MSSLSLVLRNSRIFLQGHHKLLSNVPSSKHVIVTKSGIRTSYHISDRPYSNKSIGKDGSRLSLSNTGDKFCMSRMNSGTAFIVDVNHSRSVNDTNQETGSFISESSTLKNSSTFQKSNCDMKNILTMGDLGIISSYANGNNSIIRSQNVSVRMKSTSSAVNSEESSTPSSSTDTGGNDESEFSDKVKETVDMICSLNIIEIAQVTKLLRKRTGVSMPMGGGMMMAPGAMGGMPNAVVGNGDAGSSGEESKPKEKLTFDLRLEEHGADKIKVIKEVRKLTQLGLKEAKEFVEAAPKILKKDMGKEDAEAAKKALEELGAKVSLV